MGTITIISGIIAVISILLHALPSKSSTPSTPSTPPAADAFAGVPGLPGHPLLNFLFAHKQGQDSLSALADLLKSDPAIKDKILAMLGAKPT